MTLSNDSPSSSLVTAFPTFLTRGKWVTVASNVGIIAEISSDGVAEVHYVNGAGETLVVSYVPVAQIQVARLHEIPEARRPSADRGAVLGYI